MPRVDVIHVPEAGEMGVAVEGQGSAPPGRSRPAVPHVLVMPAFDAYQREAHYVDVYNRGRTPFAFSVEGGAPWITVTPARGSVDREERLWVSVDWDAAPAGSTRVPITISGGGSGVQRITVEAPVVNPTTPRRDEVNGFVESNGYVSIEAEHFSAAVASGDVRWERIPDFGRTLSGMATLPVTAPSSTAGGSAPRLDYRVFLFDTGSVAVKAYIAPTLDYTGSPTGLRYAISFDDDPPQVVNVVADSSNRAWEQSVADDIRIASTRHHLAQGGPHVLKFWRVDPGVVLEKLVIDAGGALPSYLGPPESYHRATAPRL
jgi:hypothetical protein